MAVSAHPEALGPEILGAFCQMAELGRDTGRARCRRHTRRFRQPTRHMAISAHPEALGSEILGVFCQMTELARERNTARQRDKLAGQNHDEHAELRVIGDRVAHVSRHVESEQGTLVPLRTLASQT